MKAINILIEYGWHANASILLWLNHWLAARPELYKLATILTNKGTDVAVVATLLWMWFWREKKERSLSAEVRLPSRQDSSRLNGSRGDESEEALSGGGLAVLARAKVTVAKVASFKTASVSSDLKRYIASVLPRLTLTESRAQLLVVGAALMAAYITARFIGVEVNVSRPFATYLPLREGELSEGSFHALAQRSGGSFPSSHAVLLAALPTAVFYWDRKVGWAWAAFSALLIVIRVATGFHYPFDMLIGSLLGLGAVWGAMTLYRQEGRLYTWANAAAQGFSLSNYPYCYFLYFMLAIIGAEVFINHLNGVMQMIFSLRGMIIYRFTGGG